MALSSRISQALLCPSCLKLRYTFSIFQRAASLWTLEKNNESVEKKDTASDNKVNKYKDVSQSPIPIMAVKKARQLSKQNIRPTANTDRLDTGNLKSRLENLLVSLNGDFSEQLTAHETFEPNSDETLDEVEYITLPSNNQSNTTVSPILGTEDRDIPPSNIPCVGCGALLQCQHNTFPGFLPSEYYKSLSEREMKTSICQRCYYMRHCEGFKEVSTSAQEYESVISKIKTTQSVVVLVVDIMDMAGSIVPNLMDYIGDKHPLIVVGNKADLLSPDCPEYLGHVRDALRSTCQSAGLSNIHKVTLASAKTGFGMERLISMLFALYKKHVDLYIVGTANAGKSSLFNALLASDYCKSSARNLIERATVSVWPGTTLNLLKFPIMRPSYRVHALRQKRLKQELAQKKFKKQMERIRKKEKQINIWELKEDVNVTDTRKDFTKEHDEKDEAWGQTIDGYCGRGDGSLEYENNTKSIKEEYDADQYDSSYWTFDTPGVINPDQVFNLMTPKEMTFLAPSTMIIPRCLVLKPQETLFVSGLFRLDLIESAATIILAVHSGPSIPIHVVATSEADHFYETHIGTEILGIPIGDKERLSTLPSLVAKKLTIFGEGEKMAVADIQLSSVGWVSVAMKKDTVGTLQVFAPGRKGIHLRRPALMPNYLTFKGKRIGSSVFFRTKPPGWVMAKKSY
ncbi:hypothetical protein EGW08_005764 [Elysia chlorotica]|uniref:Uncharacterized protein n=1 Tax=Elysia chlorotica TaxID=188477 RepID=A0A3S1BQQ4_ELYCH|nr:hypothetical protein EGW08_005764 [Elysia chlorotica]